MAKRFKNDGTYTSIFIFKRKKNTFKIDKSRVVLKTTMN